MTQPSRRDFTNARANAKRRGIAWKLTFEEWSAVWIVSGHYAERGRAKGQYQMDRKDNAGIYETSNVRIVAGEVNRIKDARHGWRPKLSEGAVREIRATFKKGVRGWRYFADKFGVSVACIKAVMTGRNWAMSD